MVHCGCTDAAANREGACRIGAPVWLDGVPMRVPSVKPGQRPVSATIRHPERQRGPSIEPTKARRSPRMTHEERKTLIDRYAAGVGEVLASLEGFPEPGMTARPIPG